MKNTYLKSLLIMLVSISLVMGCAKEGEVGPKGDKGDKGDTGDKGDKGDKGDPGVFSAIYSNWLDVNWNLTDNATSKSMNIPIPTTTISTNDLRNNSIVLVYLKQWGTGSIYTMPSKGRWTNAFYDYQFGNTSACCTGLLIYLTSTDGVALTEFQYAAVRGNQIRYVILPLTSAGKHIDYKSLSYEEVCEMFDIPLE